MLTVNLSYSCRFAACESGLITCTIAIASGVHEFVDLISSHGAGALVICECVCKCVCSQLAASDLEADENM